MSNLPVRQAVSFPTVAKIRKGTPKRIGTKDGREYQMMGKDLKNKFRIEFLPGTKDIQEKWHTLHEKDLVKYGDKFVTAEGYEVNYIRAMIPTEKVMDGWRWSNETYNTAGMLIASADGERYWTKKDPITMETIVKNGEPYTEFNVGDAVQYTNSKGNKISLKLKSTGKLDLFLPELGEFVCFELRTASYLDSLYIEKNLRAIQGIANAINGGMAGGIPLDIYRVEVETPYMSNGESHKGKQWFIQIKANSEWAEAAIKRMNSFAMGGSQALLQAPSFAIPELPSIASEETDDEDGETPEKIIAETNITEGSVTEYTSEQWADKLLEEYNSVKGDKVKRKMMLEIFGTYESSANMRLVKDLFKLEECHNKIVKIKTGEV
jgi:hypothetical protein